MLLVVQQIVSAGEEFFKRDARQGQPMARCPSVPVRLFIYLSSIIRTFVLTPQELNLAL